MGRGEVKKARNSDPVNSELRGARWGGGSRAREAGQQLGYSSGWACILGAAKGTRRWRWGIKGFVRNTAEDCELDTL